MQAAAAISRSRSLFGDSPAPASGAAEAAAVLRQAQVGTVGAAAQMGELSGLMADSYRSFAHRAAGRLGEAAATDVALDRYLAQAAQITGTGAARLDGIAAQVRAIAPAAATAGTPAAQQAVLGALRSLVAQAGDVVNTTRRQAGGLAGGIRALGYGDVPLGGGPGDDDGGGPKIDGPGTPPQLEGPNTGQQDDLDSTIPGTGIALGGDGKNDHPRIHVPGQPDELNPIPVPPDAQGRPQRAIPTGTAIGPHGEHYGFYAIVPYRNPDGSPNTNFTAPQTVVVDLAHPEKVLYTLPISQASGAYDPASGRMVIVGNDPQTNARGLWESAPVSQNPGWGNTLRPAGTFQGGLNGDRENQIVALPNGKGFMLVGAANGRPIQGGVASTPEGLLTAQPKDLVGALPDGQLPYGPTITDIREINGKEVVTMRVSTYGQLPGVDPYDPRTYTTTVTVTP